jgi:hypothetical protein
LFELLHSVHEDSSLKDNHQTEEESKFELRTQFFITLQAIDLCIEDGIIINTSQVISFSLECLISLEELSKPFDRA